MNAKSQSGKKDVEAQNKKKKCIHEGHRARLIDVATNAGLENLSDVQVMEIFLAYIFPRGDTNPLAHRLLERFETLTHTVEASYGDLVSVPGINDRSAKMIQLFSNFFYYFASERLGRKFTVKTKGDMLDLVEDHLRFLNTESMFLFALSPAGMVTHKRRVSKQSSNEVETSLLEISNFLNSAKPASLVIAHGHPYGRAVPSSEDGEAFKKINSLCFSCGVNLYDSLIVGEDGVFSQRENKMLRAYCDVENLQEALVSLKNQA